MRMLNPSLAVVSLLGFLTAASCTLITDVDRTKIPTDAGAHAGEPGSGGTGGGAGETGNGGTGNKAGNGATGGTEAGSGGGGTDGGMGGTDGGTGGTNAGAAGVNEAGSGGTTPTETCNKATGSITVGVGTLIGDGDTFTLGDGINGKLTFTFDWDDGGTPITGDNVIHFSGQPTEAALAVLIRDAINDADDLDVTATTTAGGGSNGNGGAGGESGASSSGGQGGEAGAAVPSGPVAEVVQLVNDHAGARGNVTITEKLGNPNFKVSGMSGGNAVACSMDASCSSDAECDSDRTCGSGHLCE
jgi:hypothetical protein